MLFNGMTSIMGNDSIEKGNDGGRGTGGPYK